MMFADLNEIFRSLGFFNLTPSEILSFQMENSRDYVVFLMK